MTYRALIVEDNHDVVGMVEDILRSLGHEFDTATCQQEARQLMDTQQHDYYLLDLEIPVETDRGLARIQNGENLLREIIGRRGTRHAPVIVMTGHGTNGPKLAVQMMKLGAADYVTKPFDAESKTLDHAIHEALQPRPRGRPAATRTPRIAAPDESTPFEGGDMIFYPNRVELCGVVIVRGRCLMRRVLEVLRRRHRNGKYVAIGGKELAEKLDVLRGQNAISEAVRAIRNNVTEALAKEGIRCGRQDVIQSGGPGYRLSEKIVVWKDEEAECSSV